MRLWNLVILAHTVLEKKRRRMRHFRPFSNVDNFRPEVYSDVMSGVLVDPREMKTSVKLGDSRSNRSRDIRLPQFVTNDDNDDDAGRRTV